MNSSFIASWPYYCLEGFIYLPLFKFARLNFGLKMERLRVLASPERGVEREILTDFAGYLSNFESTPTRLKRKLTGT